MSASLDVPVAIDVRETNGQTRADLRWMADGDRQFTVLTTRNLSGKPTKRIEPNITVRKERT